LFGRNSFRRAKPVEIPYFKPPPPLPTSLPPDSLPVSINSQQQQYYVAYDEDPLPPKQRSLSTVERYFTVSSDDERAPRNYENSNFQQPHSYTRHVSYEPTVTHHQTHSRVGQTNSAGSTSMSSSEPSSNLQDGYSRYSLTDIPDFTAQQDDEVYLDQSHHQEYQSSHHDYEDPQSLIFVHQNDESQYQSMNKSQPHREQIVSPSQPLPFTSTPNIMNAMEVEAADGFMKQQLDMQKYLYSSKDKNSSEPEGGGDNSEGTYKGGSTIEKRFKKNKSLSKGKSVPNIEELQRQRDLILPQPFTSQNIHTAVGEISSYGFSMFLK